MATIREVLQIDDAFSQNMKKFNSLGSKMIGIATAIGGAFAAGGLIRLSDSISETNARLRMVNDGLQTSAELNDMIFAAAQRARGSYQDMAATVASLAAQTQGLFSSTAETVRFAELLSKQFALSGLNAQAISSVMYNLTQAMSMGVLRGQDYNIINANAPALLKKVADAIGVTKKELKELADEGKLTANIIKNAFMSKGKDIEDEFKQMPMTFGQAMNQLKNAFIKGFEPVSQRLSDIINSEQFQNILLGIANGIQTLMNVALKAFDMIARAVEWVRENLDMLKPVIMGVVSAFLAFQVVSAVLNGVVGIMTMLLNPVALLAAGIALVVGLIWAGITALHNFAQTGNTLLGDFMGVFHGLFAVIQNGFIAVGNAGVSFVEFIANAWLNGVYNIQMALYNFVIAAANGFNSVIDAADSAATAIANAFISGANLAIGGVNKLIDALNAIPGVSIGHVSEMGTVGSVISGRIDTSGLKMPTAPNRVQLDRVFGEATSVGEAWDKGFNKGANMGNTVQNGLVNALNGLKGSVTDLGEGFGDLGGFGGFDLGGLGGGGGGKANVGTVDKVKDVSLSDEDMKIYRDLAERRYMANVELQTLAPNISVSIPESAAKNLTSQDIADKLKAILIDQAAAHTAVAHAH